MKIVHVARPGLEVCPFGLDQPDGPAVVALQGLQPQAAAPLVVVADLSLDQPPMARLAEPNVAAVLVVPAAAWQRGMTPAVKAALQVLALPRVDLVLLSAVDTSQIKGGQPFSQLASQRDSGRCKGFGVAAQSADAVRWAVQHTPSHVILVTAETAASLLAEPDDPKRPSTRTMLIEEQVGLLVSVVGSGEAQSLRSQLDSAGLSAVVLLAGQCREIAQLPIPKERHAPGFA